MAVVAKNLSVYFYALDPVPYFEPNYKEFDRGAFPLDDALATIRKADPTSETYRLKEDMFGGETFCLVHEDGPEPILGAYYRDNLATPLAEYKGEVAELMLREGEALVDAAYAAFFPNDVVGLVRTSSKAPGFGRIGDWLTIVSGYACGLFALRDPNALAQLDAHPSKLRELCLRIRGDRLPTVRAYSESVASALDAAARISGPGSSVAVELRSLYPRARPEWSQRVRGQIEELIGVLPDFESATVKVTGIRKPINLLRSNVRTDITIELRDTKRVGPAEAARALFDAYGREKGSIDLAVSAFRR